MTNRKSPMKPKLAKILITDFPALTFVAGFILFQGMFFAFPMLLTHNQDFFSTSTYVTFSIMTLFGLVWRVLRIKWISKVGLVTPGRIELVQISRDRARIEYSYLVNGKVFVTWSPVHLTKSTKSLEHKQKVRICYDPRKPEQSFIIELYE
ncbi:TPA: hypothetical protein NGU48_003078 [Vibrio parahaemolyticus]|nr:hypothetical protein [Vibrio parahaemolyticus]HCG8761021.1 hypothetical protein [Vibrio parahaemolyticus]